MDSCAEVVDSPGGSTSCPPRRTAGGRATASSVRGLTLARTLGLTVGLLGLLGCGGSNAVRPQTHEPEETSQATLADEDRYEPAYGKPELQKALIAERGAEATAERRVSDLEARQGEPAVDDQLRVAVADLAVRRRFLAMLEACEAAGRFCPPRLDDPSWAFDPDPDRPADPPMTAAVRFDLEGWRGLTAELHGRACACRTLACVDGIGVAIDQLEQRTGREVQGDEAATTSVTRARECLFRLRGRSTTRIATPPTE
jgi:hypothetical protein